MKRTYLSATTVLLLSVAMHTRVSLADDTVPRFQPIGKELGDVSAAIDDIRGKSVVYQPTDPKEFKLFYIPFFAMEESESKSCRPKVFVEQSPTPGKSLVTLRLLLSPQKKIDAIAAFIRANAKMKAADPRYISVSSFNLTGIPLRNLSIEETSPRYGFTQVKLPEYGAQGVLRLVTSEMSLDDAERLALNIEKGNVVPEFDIRFDLATDQELSQSEIQGSMAYIYKTEAVKDLCGAKSACEKFGWKVESQGVQLNQPFVTRSGKQVFEGRVSKEVALIIRLGDDKDATFLNDMVGYFGTVFKNIVIDTDSNPLSRELAQFSSFGLDPEDLKADQLDELVLNVKNFFRQEEVDKKTFEAAASASFLGIGGSGNVKTSGESLRKRMEDAGWTFNQNGKFSVPKSFEVHTFQKNILQTTGVVSGAIIRQKRGFTRFVHRVSAASLYHPSAQDDFLQQLSDFLKQRVLTRSQNISVLVPGGFENKPQTPLMDIEIPKGLVKKGQRIGIGFDVQVDKNTGIHFIPRISGAALSFNENSTFRDSGRLRSWWELTVASDLTSVGVVADIGGTAPAVTINGKATITFVLLD